MGSFPPPRRPSAASPPPSGNWPSLRPPATDWKKEGPAERSPAEARHRKDEGLQAEKRLVAALAANIRRKMKPRLDERD